jgi:hypothetical protein
MWKQTHWLLQHFKNTGASNQQSRLIHRLDSN